MSMRWASLVMTFLGVIANEVYEPAYSFSSPFMLEAGKIPQWENAGATVITEDFVRLTPALQSKQGSIWSETDFRIVGEFRVGGGGKIGADGFAIWYTKERAEIGPAFGSRDHWTGLGVFFDTFDNDNTRDNPAVYAIYNDGSKSYQVDKDGGSDAFGRCQSQFRNANKDAWFEIRYEAGMLSVAMDATSSGQFTPCVPPTSVPLQPGYFFGISATTGGLTDNHDFYGFQVYSLGGRVGDEHPLVQAGWKVLADQKLARGDVPPPPPPPVDDFAEREAAQARAREERAQQQERDRLAQEKERQNQPPAQEEQQRFQEQQRVPEQRGQEQQYQQNQQGIPPQNQNQNQYQQNQYQQNQYQQNQYQQNQYPPQNQQAPAQTGADLKSIDNLLQILQTNIINRLGGLEARILAAENRLGEIQSVVGKGSAGLTSDQSRQLDDIHQTLRSTSQLVTKKLGQEIEQSLRLIQADVNRGVNLGSENSNKADRVLADVATFKTNILLAVQQAGGNGYLFWFSLLQVVVIFALYLWKRPAARDKLF